MAEVRERLYGDVQNYATLLIDNTFEAGALHVWETDPAAGEVAWREVGRIALAA